MIFLLNSMLLIFDIFLFSIASNTGNESISTGALVTFSIFLGAILESADLIYLILMPMLIAKNHSEKMS